MANVQPRLEGNSAAHRIAHQVRPLDLHGVEEADEPPGEVRRVQWADGFPRLSEAREVNGVDVVVACEVPQERQERCARRPKAVEQHHGRRVARPGLEEERLHSGRVYAATARRAGIALARVQEVVELEGEDEVAADEQATVEKGLDAGDLPLENSDERRPVGHERRRRPPSPPPFERNLAAPEGDRPDPVRAGVEAEARRSLGREVRRVLDARPQGGFERVEATERGAAEEAEDAAREHSHQVSLDARCSSSSS